MKALSLRADYAWDVFSGDKTVEYRSWPTKYRGDLLICATAQKIPETIPGHAIVVVRVKDVKKLGDRQYAWQLDNVRVIEPFPVKGRQRLFNVDDSLIKYHPEIDDENHPSDAAVEAFIDKYLAPLMY
ncbi:hypothetical protein IWT140_00077 [Secundilactobacillus pentosiphilus]|uniref:ASCH domain-containing protein n=1 Tax=Secundilactobacillus pentosiphilus TaxID=1714682 RepID=A0A1Z5IL37_9LACO|nr:ASCH domain-containing protein [Secundilactobacillus pentosiphilus]GAX02480.1 hypothetical protein IWT140_00077 [Secundilactobacillus pentosiphilus]